MILSRNVAKILFRKVYLFARIIHCNCSIFEKLPKKDKGLPKIWTPQNQNPAGIFQDSLALSSWDSVSCVYSNIHKHQMSGQPKGLVVFWNEILGISSLKYVSKWKLLPETISENKIFSGIGISKTRTRYPVPAQILGSRSAQPLTLVALHSTPVSQ